MASKKNNEIVDEKVLDSIADSKDASQTYNPLLVALKENDKKHLFESNVVTAFHKTGFHLFDYYFGAVINIHDKYGKIIGQEPRVGQAAGTFNLIIGNSGSGKAQPLSTKIPTPDGYKLMGDIKVGDKVFGMNGETTTVVGVYPKGEKDIYEIAFSDGRKSKCCEDHLWEVFTYSHGKDKESTLSLKEIIKDYKNFDNPDDLDRKYRIPTLASPVKFNHKNLPIDPYILGVLIGNGALKERYLSISDPIGNISAEIGRITGFMPNRNTWKNYTVNFYDARMHRVRTDDFFADLPEMIGTESSNKHIPPIYLYNDYESRIKLLQGLMDTDGSITYAEGRYHVTYSSNSKQLLFDIQQLIRSIGYNANISEDKRSYKYKNGWHGTLIFQVPNKFKAEMFSANSYKLILASDASMKPDRRKYNRLTIKEIRKVGREQAQCIYVDSPDHLYVTEDFIVTHNTTLASQIAANIIRQYPYANAIHFDCEQRFDQTRCETITHLPSSFFNKTPAERYMIRSGMVGLDTIQEMIVKTYVDKIRNKDKMQVDSGYKDEFGHEVIIFQPTVIIIDSITTVLNETFNPDSTKEAKDAEAMRSNTEGARDAKTLKGFFKDVLPLCKEANIIIYGINHINQNMSMNAFLPVAKQQNFLKQDEIIPGGKTMIYYPNNIIKLTPKPSDDFTEEGDGFTGYMVMVEPIKSSTNQSGNNSKGISFNMVFSQKYGFDSLRTMIMYGRDRGLIEGNRNRLKFKDDPDCVFSMKTLMKDKKEKPIWKDINKFIVPTLKEHLSFADPSECEFDPEELNY